MSCDFKRMLRQVDPRYLIIGRLDTLQLNLGNRCNQSCAHCHVGAGPKGNNIMSLQVMLRIIDFVDKHPDLIVDMTGGCPELNPDFRFLIARLYPLAAKLMVRTNLTVFLESRLDWIPQWYADHGVTIVASLPCYTQGNVDKQRGDGVFEKSIAVLKMLNNLGYGEDQELELNLVYNPGGNFLPGCQQQLEVEYKQKLSDDYGVRFNNLFTITNAPIGRFRQYLEANGQLSQYQQLLRANFNADAAGSIMCHNLVSVDYLGLVYNCDFNQALGLPIVDSHGCTVTIENLDKALAGGLEIITDEHCFCCTAGAGSSCSGSLVK